MKDRQWFRWCLSPGLLSLSLLFLCPRPTLAGDLINKAKAAWHAHQGVPSAEALAVEIDCLEKHIDWYGTIVAKQPDVWGQARMTKYRQEFERIMFDRLGGFQATLEGSISRIDQAYLASATSLSAAASGAPAVNLPQDAATSRLIVGRQRAALNAAGNAKPTPEQLSAVQAPTTIPIPSLDATKSGLSDFKDELQQRDYKTLGTGLSFGTTPQISLEPTEFLDQQARYLNHLHEIRRINEGDDTAASPGYALHLVRIPVSVLPGSKTRKGYGAEITITAAPVLGRDLLPTTFRNLVVNDLSEQISTPLVQFFNSKTSSDNFQNVRQARIDAVEKTRAVHQEIPILGPLPESDEVVLGMARNRVALRRGSTPVMTRGTNAPVRQVAATPPVLAQTRGASKPTPGDGQVRRTAEQEPLPMSGPIAPDALSALPTRFGFYRQAVIEKFLEVSKAPGTQGIIEDKAKQGFQVTQAVQAIADLCNTTATSVPASRNRNSRYAFPSTQLGEVYGAELISAIAFEAFDVLLRKAIEDSDKPIVMQHHLVTAYIQDQVTAAYDFLSRPESAGLWDGCATPDLARAIQSHDKVMLQTIRSSFLAMLPNSGIEDHTLYGPKYTSLAAYSWAILVESVLLNERLIQDVREAATAKGGAVPAAENVAFFLPCPSDEARDIFNAYVAIRFPIHVFALDPTVTEQNLADQLARTRELQLALSLAFVSGKISASNLTKFGRRLDTKIETIALNRTQVGFSHGEDTFGWRFQPRFQTPPTQNNLAVLAQTIGGGPTREGDRRQLELEAGPRECVAIVMMPSFVPYVTFTTRSNWYRLSSPKHSEIDALKFLELSSAIQRATQLAQGICNAGLYRPEDVGLLLNRVKQLAAELPFQSMIAQVPYENTHGGFELFNVGTTDLAPELRSWYGVPGISPNNSTSLFLSGDNFSVHDTHVVIGNKPLLPSDGFTLLSRQVMRVNVPAGTQTVVRGGKLFVEASVATPYGVSQTLNIPLVPAPEVKVTTSPVAATTFTWATPLLKVAYKSYDIGVSEAVRTDGRSRAPRDGLLIAVDGVTDLKEGVTADLAVQFSAPDDQLSRIKIPKIPYNADRGAFEIRGDNYDRFVNELFDRRFDAVLDTAPKASYDAQTAGTVLTIQGVGNEPIKVNDATNKLKIRFIPATGG